MSILKILKDLDSINYNDYSCSILSNGIIENKKKEAEDERIKSIQYFLFLLINIIVLLFMYLPLKSDYSVYDAFVFISKSSINWYHLSLYFLCSGVFLSSCYFYSKNKNISRKRASDLTEIARYISCCMIATIITFLLGFNVIALLLIIVLSIVKITSCEVERLEKINIIVENEARKIKKKKKKKAIAQFEIINEELNSNKKLREDFLSFRSEIENRKNKKYKNTYFFIFNNIFRKESEGLTKDNLINYLECKLKNKVVKKENKITTE